jgi:medium-chain acyl-[acyl-carrier-protein] hydrolase
MPTIGPNPWLPSMQPGARSHGRLFCFPYAGGGASVYRAWGPTLAPGVEVCAVQPPGRGSRLNEPACDNVDVMVERLIDALGPYLDVPFACFGHSMGAIVSFELARALRRAALPQPMALFISGRRAPRCPDPEPPVHDLPEAEFVKEVRALNGTPEELLLDPELMTLVLPTLRADFTLCETYVYRAGRPLACPIHVFGGEADPNVGRDVLEPWREETTAGCDVRMFEGDHFFIHSAQAQVLQALTDDLRRTFSWDTAVRTIESANPPLRSIAYAGAIGRGAPQPRQDG